MGLGEALVEFGLVEGEFVEELGLVVGDKVKDAEQGGKVEGGDKDKFSHNQAPGDFSQTDRFIGGSSIFLAVGAPGAGGGVGAHGDDHIPSAAVGATATAGQKKWDINLILDIVPLS